jgi:hypothetical protein
VSRGQLVPAASIVYRAIVSGSQSLPRTSQGQRRARRAARRRDCRARPCDDDQRRERDPPSGDRRKGEPVEPSRRHRSERRRAAPRNAGATRTKSTAPLANSRSGGSRFDFPTMAVDSRLPEQHPVLHHIARFVLPRSSGSTSGCAAQGGDEPAAGRPVPPRTEPVSMLDWAFLSYFLPYLVRSWWTARSTTRRCSASGSA